VLLSWRWHTRILVGSVAQLPVSIVTSSIHDFVNLEEKAVGATGRDT